MNRKCRDELFRSDIEGYIAAVARRHFRDEADREDARQDAREAIERACGRHSVAEYRRIAYRAINARYKRERRRWLREVRIDAIPGRR